MSDPNFTTLKPAPGRVIPNPAASRDLAAEGDPVALDRYWRQLLKDGDVVEVSAKAAPTNRKKGDA